MVLELVNAVDNKGKENLIFVISKCSEMEETDLIVGENGIEWTSCNLVGDTIEIRMIANPRVHERIFTRPYPDRGYLKFPLQKKGSQCKFEIGIDELPKKVEECIAKKYTV